MSLLGFLLSPMSVFVWGLGLIGFLVGPLVSKRLANLHLWLMAWCMKRFAIVVTEHNELLVKTMDFVDLGVEQMSFGESSKSFEDPAAALHHWMGFPFAFADEESGTLFDPRHAALGMRKRDLREKGLGAIPASNTEWERHGIYKWMPMVFEMPSSHELVDLNAVSEIIGGGERAEYPNRIEELYKLSRTPFGSRTSMMRLAMPVIAFFGVFAGLGLLSSQVSGGGGGTTVSFDSMSLLAGTGGIAGTLKEYGWRRVALVAAGSLIPLGVFVLVSIFAGIAVAIAVFVVFGLGFIFTPAISLLARASSRASGFLATTLYLKLGLLGYRTPVLVWEPDGYSLVDESELGDVNVNKWYTLAGTKFGVTYLPEEDSFGPDVIEEENLETTNTAVADGGDASEMPPGYVANPSLRRGRYAGYVPETLSDNSFFLNAGIALNRMANAANGEKSLRRLLESKEKYGDGDTLGVSDKTIAYATFASTIIAGGLGVWVFFL